MKNLKYLIFILFICLFSIKPTYAINFDPYKWNGIQIGSNNGLTFYGDEEKTFDIDLEYFGSISDEMSEKYGLLKAWNGSGGSNGTTYNFLITACSADISFESFANRHNYIVKSVYSSTPCKTQDGWNRKLEYHFVKMTPTGYNVGNSDTFTVTWNTTVTFKNKYSWPNLFEITNVDILTDDEFKSLMNEYENIAKLEEQIASIRDTNSKLDTQINQNQTIIDQNNQINNNLTNSTVDDPTNSFNQFESYLPENGVITELITLPISLFQRVLSSINGTCSQYNLGNLLGTDLILPCINISNYIGTTLWNVIDILFSGLFVLVIGKKMIKAFNNFSSMEEGDVLD